MTSRIVRGLRTGFAFRTVVGGVALVVTVVLLASVVVVAAHRQQQVQQVGETAHARATVVAELIDKVSVAEATASARDLASRPQLVAVLGGASSATALHDLLAQTSTPQGVELYVVGMAGDVSAVPGSAAWPASPEAAAAVRPALRGSQAAAPVLIVAGGQLADVVAVPVASAAGTVGAVAAVIPLPAQARRFAPAVSEPVLLFDAAARSRAVLVEPGNNATSDATAAASGVAGQVRGGVAEARVETAPGDSVVDVLRLPSTAGATGYVGVVVAVPGFLATEGATILTVALLALLAAALTSLAVWIVVDRWVRRPVARLERGVARIAEGEYDTEIAVHSDDELSRLALSVNRMARQISGAMTDTRAALDNLRWVSEALTAIDRGVDELAVAVARTAAAIAGDGAGACLIRRDAGGSTLFTHGDPGDVSAERAAAERGDTIAGVRRSNDGTWCTSFPLSIDDGAVTGRLVTCSPSRLAANDVAALTTLARYAGLVLDHARLREQEQETVRRLRAAEASRNDFLSTTHHELRTPLSIVLGMAELAESSWEQIDDDARRHTLADIVAGARRLARTIENVLAMTVLASEEVPLSRRPLPLRPLVDGVVRTAAERWQSEGARRVSVAVADDLAVDADADLFERMLDALVDNATKFTQPGGRVRISAEQEASAVVLRVRDDGVGVPPDALPHVFERFFMAEKGYAREFGGLGLGLTIAARICAVHGATIELDSAETRGATVTVRWPSAGTQVLSGAPMRAGRRSARV